MRLAPVLSEQAFLSDELIPEQALLSDDLTPSVVEQPDAVWLCGVRAAVRLHRTVVRPTIPKSASPA